MEGSAPQGATPETPVPPPNQVHNEHVPAKPYYTNAYPPGSVTQTLPPTGTVRELLAEMTRRAGVIFVGEVYAIRMPQGSAKGSTAGGMHSSDSQAVEIEFRVDQGIRGASIGSTFVLKEWVGLWQNRPAPFQNHERAVVFLYTPNAAGLSSPVAGALGVVPIQSGGVVDLSRLHAQAGAASNGEGDQSAGAHDGSQATASTGMAGDLQGEGALSSSMPELEAPSIPFLAFLRDLFVLAAANGGTATDTTAPQQGSSPAVGPRPQALPPNAPHSETQQGTPPAPQR